MSEEKPNYLATGITSALSSKASVPPPPIVRRPRERSTEDEEQTTETADSHISEKEKIRDEGKSVSEAGAPSANTFTDEQVRMLAEMITNANATTQQNKKAKRQKIDLVDLLIETIANIKSSENIKEQFSKLANSQREKINQGVFAPEALFTIYKNSAVQLGLAGKKIGMGDLMAKALIAYIPEIIKELEQE